MCDQQTDGRMDGRMHRVIAALKHWDMGENPITFIDFDNFFFKIKMNSEMVWKKPLSLLRVV